MTKYQRAKQRIARDKAMAQERHINKYGENDNFERAMNMQHMCEAVFKCQKGVRWKGSVQRYIQHAITNMYKVHTDQESGKPVNLASSHIISLYERGKKREMYQLQSMTESHNVRYAITLLFL
jgi:hypothetical protein